MKAFRLIICLVLVSVFASRLSAQEIKQVEASADDAEFNQSIAGGAQRLIGNVRFTHEGAIMYCDSAYFYGATNSLDAFNRVHINQADTVDLYGDFLHYDGNTRIAEIRRNVRLVGSNTTLTTEALDFDLGKNAGYYTNHADIVSGDNKLNSIQGYYYANQEMYYFRDSVVLRNPDYTIYSDTLQYHTPTSIAYFFGPTEIIGDSSYIYCEDGWYNTETDKSMLRENALVRNNKQTIKGDTLYYEKVTGYGEGYSNIEIFDEEQNIILRGNRAFINQNEDRALLTDSALFIYITKDDSLYVHADTLRSRPDSAGTRELMAYYGVRIFKSDLQGLCDSLFYSTADSVLKLFHKPVLWSETNQLSSDYMEIWTKNKEVDQLHMKQLAFIINQEDSARFNQIKGRSMTGYFRNNELYKIITKGNGQTVYYAKDKDELIGVNIAQSSDITIWLRENKPDKISFQVKPTGTLYPLDTAPKEELILKDFKWLEVSRPKDRNDIFRKE
ncbi:MAG: organic solvent tolerance protein OstA [Bacteroidales bacterium]|nr:organic solvent tolerance protein OstA [Bacteroidales bacterium]